MDLERSLYAAYFGLLIVTPCITHEQEQHFTGVVERGRTMIVRHGFRPNVYRIHGSPLWPISRVHVKVAATVGEGIDQLLKASEHNRVWRLTHAFHAGLRAPEASVRLHQFFRCVEGFVHPAQKKIGITVTQRARLFLGDGYDDPIDRLWLIRSKIEHLEGALTAIPGTSLFERNIRLFAAAFQAEQMARHCLTKIFSKPELRPYLRTDKALTRFWTELTSADRDQLWGEKLDMRAVTKAFDHSQFRPDQFG